MAIEISPSDEHEPDETPEETAEEIDGSPILQPVPPQDSPTQFYEWALRREQLRLRRMIWVFAAFAGFTLLVLGLLAYLVWDTRNDNGPVRDVVIQQDPDAANVGDLQELRDDFAAFSSDVEERLEAGGVSEETLGEIAEDVESLGRQLARTNRQTAASVACLNGAVASLDEAVRDLLRQDMSANEFVQRPSTNCS